MAEARAPASLGALPLALGRQGDLVLPLAAGEACWIGLDLGPACAPLQLTLAVQSTAGAWLDAQRGRAWQAESADLVTVAGPGCIAGYRQADGGLHVFVRDGGNKVVTPCQQLRLRVADPAGAAAPCEVTIRLLDPATFACESGQPAPAPMDPAAGYRGWRLP